MKQFNKYKFEICAGIVLILLGIATRTFLHIGPNFELVTAISILAATQLSSRRSWLIVAAIMIASDIILGNTNILIFTWSGFAITFLLGTISKNYLQTQSYWRKFFTYEALGLVSVLAFYFWTNFGVVILGTMYAHSWAGYMQSLYMALPFLKIQLQSAIIFVPLLSLGYELIKNNHGSLLAQLQKQKA